VAVDESLGELQYVPPQGRYPDQLTYEIRDADDSLASTGVLTLRLDPMRVMPLGDSITHGVEVGTGDLDLPSEPLRIGYRKALLEQLTAAGLVIDYTGQGGQRAGEDTGLTDTDNSGYPGVTVSFINDKVLEVLAEQPSDAILLHIGTNETPADAQGIDAILDSIDSWEQANHPITVFVATLVPKRDPALQVAVDAFNADLRVRVAARSDDDVVLVEQANAITIDNIDPDDIGVHPNAVGYELMADTWFNAMNTSGLFPECAE